MKYKSVWDVLYVGSKFLSKARYTTTLYFYGAISSGIFCICFFFVSSLTSLLYLVYSWTTQTQCQYLRIGMGQVKTRLDQSLTPEKKINRPGCNPTQAKSKIPTHPYTWTDVTKVNYIFFSLHMTAHSKFFLPKNAYYK